MSQKTLTIDYDLYHEELEESEKEGYDKGFEEGEKSMKKYFIEAMITPDDFYGSDWRASFLEEFPDAKPLLAALDKAKFYEKKGDKK